MVTTCSSSLYIFSDDLDGWSNEVLFCFSPGVGVFGSAWARAVLHASNDTERGGTARARATDPTHTREHDAVLSQNPYRGTGIVDGLDGVLHLV